MSQFDPPPPPPGYPPPPQPGYPAGPPPGFPPPQPGYPGQPGQPGQPGGSRKGLWITLAVLGLVVLAGLVVVLVLVLGRDGSDDADKDGRSSTPTSADANPATVVGSLLDAGLDGDCEAGLSFLTEQARADDPCGSDEFEALAAGEVTYTLGDAEIDGDSAVVAVQFSDDAGDEDYEFTLEAADGEWLVSGWAPTDGGSTDIPTDTPTDASTDAAPSGDSTASAVPNDPASVAEALYRSTLAGDCATANDLVTDAFKAREGECEPTEVPTDLFDGLEVEAGEAAYNDAGDEATVPVDLVFSGESFATTFTVIEVDGQWLVDNVDGEM